MTFDGTNLVVAGNITSSSDERLKIQWQELLPDFLAQLAMVKAGSFFRTDLGVTQIGVSAQDVQRLVPQAVHQDENGLLSISYGHLALVSCVQLARRVIDLDHAVASLKNKREND